MLNQSVPIYTVSLRGIVRISAGWILTDVSEIIYLTSKMYLLICCFSFRIHQSKGHTWYMSINQNLIVYPNLQKKLRYYWGQITLVVKSVD
jgi:hypothetical protein